MKMKKSVVGAMALALLAMSACTSESIQSPDIPSTSEEVAGRISFSISLPAGDPISYRAIQTDAEKRVERLDVYQFTSGANSKLEAHHQNVTLTPSGNGYSLTLGVRTPGAKDFVFVANNETGKVGSTKGLTSLPIGTSRAEFDKTLTVTLNDGESLISPLTMTAVAENIIFADGAVQGNQTPKVELERIMARMDIQNFEPQLKITHVTMVNVADRTFLMPQMEGNVSKTDKPAEAQLIKAVRMEMPADLLIGDHKVELDKITVNQVPGLEYRHVAYPYIATGMKLNSVGEEAAPGARAQMVLEGILYPNDTQNTTKVTYLIDLKKEGTNEFISFARNTRYTLVIKKAFPDAIDCTVMVDPWNEVIVEAPFINPITPIVTNILYYNWNPTKQTLSDNIFTTSIPAYNADVHTEVGKLYVQSNTEWEVLKSDGSLLGENNQITDWLIAEVSNDYWVDKVPLSFFPRTLLLKATKNSTGNDRSVKIRIRSKADKNLESELTIIQKPFMEEQ